jgi:outer membrane protein OmpA-like peptidoglycan-associated protein
MRVLALLLLASASICTAQTYTEQLGLRVNAGLSVNTHSGSVSTTAPLIDCGELTSGSGLGPSVSLGLELPFSKKIGLGVEIGLVDRSGSFSRTNTYSMRDPVSGDDVILTTDLVFAPRMNYIEFAPSVIIPILGTMQHRRLGVSLAPRIGLPIAKSFEQRETVVRPDNAVFIVDGVRTQERILSSGQLLSPSATIVGASASIESFIQLSDRLALVPRVSADMIFTSLVADATWNTFGVRAEIGLRLSSGKTIAPPVEAPPPPPVIVERPQEPVRYAQPRIALGVRRVAGSIVTGNELRATPPIVNAVFFDSASADIPLSYRRSRDGSLVSTDPVDAHAWVMMRIASIVGDNPSARVILEGATSGATSEPEGIVLAQRRAEAVRRTLIDMGVPASVITTKASTLPRVASNNDYALGREENRRVDIVVQNAPLQQWVSAQEFAVFQSKIDVQTTYAGGNPAERPALMTVSVNGRDSVIPSAGGTTTLSVDIPLPDDGSAALVSVVASAGGVVTQIDTAVSTEGLQQRRIALRTDRFQAILRFDYNAKDLSEDDKILLRQLVEQVPDGSTILIEGSSDILGSDERNRALSQQRAASTESYMRSVAGKNLTYVTRALAERFSDTTPQGRFLNRNIHVRVITP